MALTIAKYFFFLPKKESEQNGFRETPTLQKSQPTLQERKSGQLFLAETFVTLRWNSNGLEKLETATIVKCR